MHRKLFRNIWTNMLIYFQTLFSLLRDRHCGVGLSSFSWGGLWELLTCCPQFCGNQTHRRSHCLHSWDPAGHLCFINPCNFKTLDRFKHSWLATAPAIWNKLPTDIILWGEAYGWHTLLQEAQCCICNWHLWTLCCNYEVYYNKKWDAIIVRRKFTILWSDGKHWRCSSTPACFSCVPVKIVYVHIIVV